MTMRNTLNRLTNAFRMPDRQQAIRDYLDNSVSMTDLERRQREVDQGKFNAF